MNYEERRAQLLAEAEAAVNNHEFEKFQNIQKEIEKLDGEHEEEMRARANLEAMNKPTGVKLENSAVKVSGNSVDSVSFGGETEPEDWRASNEYRRAFYNYWMKGTAIPDKFSNTDATTVTSDVGAVIPSTVTRLVIPKLAKAGKIWSRITKLNVKGGVSVPVADIRPEAKWVAERGTSETQKGGTTPVTFAYHKLICKVAVSLEVSVVTVDEFETALADAIVEAMLRKFEIATLTGEGSTYYQPEGILTKTPADGQTIEIAASADVTYDDFVAAEAALPEEYDNAAWFMTKKTFFGTVMSLKNSDGDPLGKKFEGIDGKPAYTIFGREVVLLPSDYVDKYQKTVSKDTIFAFIYDFKDYVANTNLEIGIREYIDEDTDDRVKKSIMLVDGKPVLTNSLVTMVKKNT